MSEVHHYDNYLEARIAEKERQLAETQGKLERIEEVTEKHLEGCPSAPCTLPQEIAHILKEE